MPGRLRHIFLAIIFCTLNYLSFAQADNYTIRNIELQGNNKTQGYVIKRELSFQEGDSIKLQDLPILFERGERQLNRMGIFTQVTFNLGNLSTETREFDVVITVKERWPIYIVPMVELADRNFNVWWTDYNHELRRINYSLKLYYINLTGRNDELQAKAQLGFSKKYELKYNLPSLKKLPQWGIGGNMLYGLENDLRYETVGHREVFMRMSGANLYKRFRVEGMLTYRKAIYNSFILQIGYYKNRIDPLVLDRNPDFFGNNRLEQKYLALSGKWFYDTRNNRIFPTMGNLLRGEVNRYGLHKSHDVNYWEAIAFANVARPLAPKLTLTLEGEARKQFTEEILPYTHRRALNWEKRILEGYDYYLLDGTDFLTMKIGLFYNLFTYKAFLGSWFPLQSYRNLEVDVILGLRAASAYLYDNNNTIENFMDERLLYSIGPEVTFLINNFSLGTGQIAINHLGEIGLYLRARVAFGI